MAPEDAFEHAFQQLNQQGGLITVVLGEGVDAPTEWSFHPRVHWLLASNLRGDHARNAIPPNTRLMVFTDRIDSEVYRPLRDECERRRLPHMSRKTREALDVELKKVFTVVKRPVEPVPDAPTNGNVESTASAETARKTAPRGSIKEFLDKHAERNSTLSTAEEGRRLFRLAQVHGFETTVGSLTQGVRLWRRARSLGDRPESAVTPHIADSLAASAALDAAILGLTQVRARVEQLDTECAALRAENADLRMRIGLMKDAFAGL